MSQIFFSTKLILRLSRVNQPYDSSSSRFGLADGRRTLQTLARAGCPWYLHMLCTRTATGVSKSPGHHRWRRAPRFHALLLFSDTAIAVLRDPARRRRGVQDRVIAVRVAEDLIKAFMSFNTAHQQSSAFILHQMGDICKYCTIHSRLNKNFRFFLTADVDLEPFEVQL